ncbi:MAG TPA: hypothetical protein VFA49_10245 [Chloroflexota bacterium]|nr:hypothetical protein [Chloroflexota bacterium]
MLPKIEAVLDRLEPELTHGRADAFGQVPPLLYGLTPGSRDHTEERYRDVLLPTLAEMQPPPKARLVVFGAGVHGYMRPEPDLPKGIGPAVARLWHSAITEGYYVS